MASRPIILEETDNEYLLTIHASEKVRVWRIENRQWDRQRRKWTFPRTPRVYHSIISEFGDELDNRTSAAVRRGLTELRKGDGDLMDAASLNSALSGGAQVYEIIDPDPNPLQKQITHATRERDKALGELERHRQDLAVKSLQLDQALAEIDQLRAQVADRGSSPDLSELVQMLEERNRELSHIRASLRESEIRIEQKNASLNEYKQEHARLKKIIQERTPTNNGKQFLFDLALTAAAADERFSRLLQSQKLNTELPLVLCSELEASLRSLVPESDRATNLYGLLTLAGDCSLFTEDQLDLAHFIRRQRNMIVHEVDRLDNASKLARVLLMLFSAALLWPALSRD